MEGIFDSSILLEGIIPKENILNDNWMFSVMPLSYQSVKEEM